MTKGLVYVGLIIALIGYLGIMFSILYRTTVEDILVYFFFGGLIIDYLAVIGGFVPNKGFIKFLIISLSISAVILFILITIYFFIWVLQYK